MVIDGLQRAKVGAEGQDPAGQDRQRPIPAPRRPQPISLRPPPPAPTPARSSRRAQSMTAESERRLGRLPCASSRDVAMSFSHFMIDRPVFAAVIAILITLLGGIAYPNLGAAQYPVDRASDGERHPDLSGRLGRDHRRDRGRSHRGADQRGGGHDLHVVLLHRRRQPADHRHLQARHRSRQGPGAGPEPGGPPPRLACPSRCSPPGSRCARVRRTSSWPCTCTRRTSRSTRPTSPTTSPCRCSSRCCGSRASATSPPGRRATTPSGVAGPRQDGRPTA